MGQPFGITLIESSIAQAVAIVGISLGTVGPLKIMLFEIPFGTLTRHEFEAAIIKFLTGFGYVLFTAVVAIPFFFVMVMTSFKSQQALLLNPLDYSLDLSKGWGLFRSYVELFSVPGAYAVARLRFKGQTVMSRSTNAPAILCAAMTKAATQCRQMVCTPISRTGIAPLLPLALPHLI